ncbi:mismatch-specific DNA-glycosylase [Streptomyces chartreusis]|uniref:mismatch-specific DNA-glycosylase n=1 Tax=Streptomyces chartreusis TaxID=1969 RepID=UPI00380088C3
MASALRGHSFSTPGNRMWPALHRSGFTPHQFRPEQERDLLGLGLGITSIVRRPTVRAAELTPDEYLQGGEDLVRRMEALSPVWLAFLGVTGYRAVRGRRRGRGRAVGDHRGSTRMGPAEPQWAQCAVDYTQTDGCVSCVSAGHGATRRVVCGWPRGLV